MLYTMQYRFDFKIDCFWTIVWDIYNHMLNFVLFNLCNLILQYRVLHRQWLVFNSTSPIIWLYWFLLLNVWCRQFGINLISMSCYIGSFWYRLQESIESSMQSQCMFCTTEVYKCIPSTEREHNVVVTRL